jgi:hypothetical protein
MSSRSLGVEVLLTGMGVPVTTARAISLAHWTAWYNALGENPQEANLAVTRELAAREGIILSALVSNPWNEVRSLSLVSLALSNDC